MTAKSKESTELAPVNIPNTAQLKNVNSFEDAIRLSKELNASIISAAELGDGFALLENKDELIGKPCLFITWTFHDGDYGQFVAARVLAQLAPNAYAKYVVIDGSSGVKAQLEALSVEDSGASMLYAQNGLRRSDYKYTDDTGEEKPATTYYIDTSGDGKLAA